MNAPLQQVLAHMDSDQVRAESSAMRCAATHIAEATSALWTSSWANVVPALVSVGRTDLCLGRLVEGHADAMRILQQADVAPGAGLYGVWASRSAGTGLRATRRADRWELTGELRFASGIDVIDRALVPGWIDADHHLLFDVAIAEFTADRASWPMSAMDASRSFTCRCEGLLAGDPVGPTDFYLTRPGFAVGGIGPAAVWAGGLAQVADLTALGLSRFASNVHQRRRLGLIDQARWQAIATLTHTASIIDDPATSTSTSSEVSHARSAVVTACDQVIEQAALIVGPGGLSTDTRLVRARDDLAMYVRQHHLDFAMEAGGAAVLEAVGRRSG